jgi:hypothetical protein
MSSCKMVSHPSAPVAGALVAIVLIIVSGCAGLKPDAPKDVVAIPGSSGEILLKWTPLPEAQEYEILRREGASGPYQVLGRMQRQASSLLNTVLKTHTIYFFKLRACNRFGCSEYSQEISAETR